MPCPQSEVEAARIFVERRAAEEEAANMSTLATTAEKLDAQAWTLLAKVGFAHAELLFINSMLINEADTTVVAVLLEQHRLTTERWWFFHRESLKVMAELTAVLSMDMNKPRRGFMWPLRRATPNTSPTSSAPASPAYATPSGAPDVPSSSSSYAWSADKAGHHQPPASKIKAFLSSALSSMHVGQGRKYHTCGQAMAGDGQPLLANHCIGAKQHCE